MAIYNFNVEQGKWVSTSTGGGAAAAPPRHPRSPLAPQSRTEFEGPLFLVTRTQAPAARLVLLNKKGLGVRAHGARSVGGRMHAPACEPPPPRPVCVCVQAC